MSGRSNDIVGRTRQTTIAQAVVTADAQAAGVDIRELSGQGYMVVTIGTPNAADNTVEVQIQESSDNGVADAFVDVALATTGLRTSDVAEVVIITPIDFNGVERFLRASFEQVAGTAPSYEIAVVAISSAHVLPTG